MLMQDFKQYMDTPTSNNHWKVAFEILWAIGATSLAYYMYLRWPHQGAQAHPDENTRFLTFGMFVFTCVVIRWGFYNRLNLKAFIINLLTSLYLVVLTAEALHILGVRVLGVATGLYALFVAIIIVGTSGKRVNRDHHL
ncbi:MAG TPA: hypothetical protein VFX47_05710 [Gammaproteobacteria bacterium]|nr:hypothetical protein [Gammaproteobacteria bacterium]